MASSPKTKSASVYPVGTPVTIGKDIEAVITAISLRGTLDNLSVKYEVAWWREGARKTEWLDPVELVFRSGPPDKSSIGFQNGGHRGA